MKLGLELSSCQLDPEHYRFARQCGCTHLALQLPAGFRPGGGAVREAPAASGRAGEQAAQAGPDDALAYEDLARLIEEANAEGLQIEAVGSADPGLCLDAPRGRTGRGRGPEKLRATLRNVGGVGIPLFMYQVSVPGSVAAHRGRGTIRSRRLEARLAELLPMATAAGVTLVAQAMEPLLPAARFVFSVADAAAAGTDVYALLEAHSRRGRIACLRLGSAGDGGTQAHACFVDNGGVDMRRVVRILRRTGYTGLIVPGRVPGMNCAAPWHAAAAHALGYLRAALAADGVG